MSLAVQEPAGASVQQGAPQVGRPHHRRGVHQRRRQDGRVALQAERLAWQEASSRAVAATAAPRSGVGDRRRQVRPPIHPRPSHQRGGARTFLTERRLGGGGTVAPFRPFFTFGMTVITQNTKREFKQFKQASQIGQSASYRTPRKARHMTGLELELLVQ